MTWTLISWSYCSTLKCDGSQPRQMLFWVFTSCTKSLEFLQKEKKKKKNEWLSIKESSNWFQVELFEWHFECINVLNCSIHCKDTMQGQDACPSKNKGFLATLALLKDKVSCNHFVLLPSLSASMEGSKGIKVGALSLELLNISNHWSVISNTTSKSSMSSH